MEGCPVRGEGGEEYRQADLAEKQARGVRAEEAAFLAAAARLEATAEEARLAEVGLAKVSLARKPWAISLALQTPTKNCTVHILSK